MNSNYDIPERYRSKARVLDLGEAQKSGNSSGEQITPALQGKRSDRVAPIHPARVENPGTGQRRDIRRKFMRPENSWGE